MKTKTQNHQTKNQNKGNSGSESGLENRNENINTDSGAAASGRDESGRNASFKIDLELRRNNRALPTSKLLEILQDEAPTFWHLAEVVGNWVWIQFKEKQPREVTAVLSQLGFHWNNTRQAWQHPCGNFTQKPASYDPREKYGSLWPSAKTPADHQAA